jgi:hypothetical protein
MTTLGSSDRITGYPDRTRKWGNVRIGDENEAADAADAIAWAVEESGGRVGG